MHHTTLSSALLLLITSALAAPAPAPAETGVSFKLHRVSTGAYRPRTGVMAMEKIYRKYQWTLPEGLAAAATTDREKVAKLPSDWTPPPNNKIKTSGAGGGVAHIGMRPEPYDAEYLAPVSVGGQTMVLDIDTGSSDTWVFNTNLRNNHANHNLFDPKKSKTYKAHPELAVGVEYGDDTNMKGQVGTDTVQIGGIAVKDHYIELPTSVSSGLLSDNSEGILGLGFQSMNSITANGKAAPKPSWFEMALPSLRQPLFTVNFKEGRQGQFVFGDIDHSAYQGDDLTWVPLDNSTGYWAFESSQYAIGKGSTQTNNGGSHQAVPDTGASLFYVDPAVVNAYYANVKGKIKSKTGMMTYPCAEQLPDFHVAIGKDLVPIPGGMLNWKPDTVAGMCVGGVQTNEGQPPQVYGDILFNLYFFVFDYGNRRIGYAPHA